MSVASWPGSLLGWEVELSALRARLGRLFGRRELRESAAAFLDGVVLAKLRADLRRTSMPEAVPGKRNERSLRLVGAHS